MRDTDVAAVARLEGLAFPSAGKDLGGAEERERRLREELARPWSHAWVVRDASLAAVAFLLAWLVADEVHVLDVATHPSRRREGIGKALVETALSFARSRRATHVRLEVRRTNEPAIRLYRAAGFYVLS